MNWNQKKQKFKYRPKTNCLKQSYSFGLNKNYFFSLVMSPSLSSPRVHFPLICQWEFFLAFLFLFVWFKQGCSLSLGKIITDKALNKKQSNRLSSKDVATLKISPLLIWESTSSSSISTMQTQPNKKRILEEATWNIMRALLNLHQWVPQIAMHVINFSFILYWIQIHGASFTVANTAMRGRKLGDVIDVENPIVENSIMRSFFVLELWLILKNLLSLGSGCLENIFLRHGLASNMRNYMIPVITIGVLVTARKIADGRRWKPRMIMNYQDMVHGWMSHPRSWWLPS